jgi:hypothetical protein
MATPLQQLMAQAEGPLGHPATVDFGIPEGALHELATMLTDMNGFIVFGAGVHVFRAGTDGVGPELLDWNTGDPWKDTYGGLADNVFCFGQDVLGTQFGIAEERVVIFDPETGDQEVLGDSLNDWAAWLLEDPEENGTSGLAAEWERLHGPLHADQRLIPRQLFALGGEYTVDNLVVKNAAEAMRIRGPIAAQIHDLPDGAQVSFEFKD